MPDKAPIIGDNVYIAPGVKIFGDVKIADNCCIGANAVVNKTINEEGVTVAGIPAEKISNKNSDNMLKKGTYLFEVQHEK
jgi:serine O-acetyltransferase